MILSSGQARHFSPPPPLPDYQIKIATEGLRALNNMACVDLKTLQVRLNIVRSFARSFVFSLVRSLCRSFVRSFIPPSVC